MIIYNLRTLFYNSKVFFSDYLNNNLWTYLLSFIMINK
uniref:Uncharacterized protein n=1 Tax=viral metagenome TaxID=1070528 RepID=A0A6C0H9F6_9ZZZZ